MTIPILLAAIVAAIAGFLSAIRPEQWMPFYRAGISARTSRSNVITTLYIGRIGQAIGTCLVGLLTTIFALGIFGFADNRIGFWGGVLVAVMSIVFFVRQRRSSAYDKDRTASLAEIAGRLNANPRPRPADDPFGSYSGTLGVTLQHAVLSPGFVVSPMFLAAAVSGLPHVSNAVSVVIVFVAATIIGLIWSTRLVNSGVLTERYHTLVRNGYLILAYTTLILGIVTAIIDLV